VRGIKVITVEFLLPEWVLSVVAVGCLVAAAVIIAVVQYLNTKGKRS